jgi:phospholipid transport system substrate-binding protein
MARITKLVNEKILPYTDFTRTTRLVMRRNWNSATPQQQQQIVEQFKLLLIRTYSGALAQARDKQIAYQPFHSSPADTDVVVRSAIVNNRPHWNSIIAYTRLRKDGACMTLLPTQAGAG